MTTRAHIVVAVVAAVAVAIIGRMVNRQQLRSKYALLWLVVAVALLPLAVAPQMLDWAGARLGILYSPAAFLLLATGFLFAVVVHYSWELSRLEVRTRLLAEEVALLRARTDAVPPDAPDAPGAPGAPDARDASGQRAPGAPRAPE